MNRIIKSKRKIIILSVLMVIIYILITMRDDKGISIQVYPSINNIRINLYDETKVVSDKILEKDKENVGDDIEKVFIKWWNEDNPTKFKEFYTNDSVPKIGDEKKFSNYVTNYRQTGKEYILMLFKISYSYRNENYYLIKYSIYKEGQYKRDSHVLFKYINNSPLITSSYDNTVFKFISLMAKMKESLFYFFITGDENSLAMVANINEDGLKKSIKELYKTSLNNDSFCIDIFNQNLIKYRNARKENFINFLWKQAVNQKETLTLTPDLLEKINLDLKGVNSRQKTRILKCLECRSYVSAVSLLAKIRKTPLSEAATVIKTWVGEEEFKKHVSTSFSK